MNWQLLLSVIFALVYLAWIWRSRRVYRRIGFTLCLIGSAGILITLTCNYIHTLPSHAPLRTITGLAWGRSSNLFPRSHSEFILTETGTDQRFLFTTVIDGPWDGQPVRATYVDNGRKIPSVVRIEILRGDQFPWHVQKGHAGWVGTTVAKRSTPLTLNFIGFIFTVAGVFAPAIKTKDSNTQDENATVPGGCPPIVVLGDSAHPQGTVADDSSPSRNGASPPLIMRNLFLRPTATSDEAREIMAGARTGFLPAQNSSSNATSPDTPIW